MNINYTFIIFIILAISAIFARCDPLYDKFSTEAKRDFEILINARRYLHLHAEIGFKEYETSSFVQSFLKENNINFTSGWGVDVNDTNTSYGTGVVAEIGTGNSPCVALRADMDALPITEIANVDFKSLNKGVMHACGHDSHTAMLLGAAKILKAYEKEIQGTVRLIFQPAEEGGGGALMMVNEGVLKKYPPVERISGLHISHKDPTGSFSSRAGTIQAGSWGFKIIVKGKGGHAAFHHKTIDPLTASAAIVRSLYDVYTSELYYQHEHAGVISITYLDAGSKATNVIPDEVEIGGTLRALTMDKLNYMKSRFYKVVESTAQAFRCTSEITQVTTQYIPTVIDKNLYILFKDSVSAAGLGPVTEVQPVMGAEDFSFFANEVPGVFFRIGSGSASEIPGHPPSDYPTHNAQFVLDERVLPIGASFHAYFAIKMLDDLNEK